MRLTESLVCPVLRQNIGNQPFLINGTPQVSTGSRHRRSGLEYPRPHLSQHHRMVSKRTVRLRSSS